MRKIYSVLIVLSLFLAGVAWGDGWPLIPDQDNAGYVKPVGDKGLSVPYVVMGSSHVKISYNDSISDWFDASETGSIAWHIANGKKHISVGSGTYPYSDTLNIDTSGVTIIGAGMGVTVFSKAGGDGMKGILVDDDTTQVEYVLLKDFTLDGNRASFAHPRSYSHGIDIKYAKNIVIDGVSVVEAGDDTNTHTTGGSGISVNHEASEITIKNCYLDDNEDRAIQLGGSNVVVKNCFVDSAYDRGVSCNMEDDNANNRDATDVIIDANIIEDSTAGSGVGVYGSNKNISITNNIIKRVANGGLRLRYIDTSGQRNILFSGNQVIDSSYGVVTYDIQPVYSGTSTGGNTTQTIKDTGANWPLTVRYTHCVVITGGTGAGQCRRITGGTTTVLYINNDADWSTTPDATSTYAIYTMEPLGIAVNNNVFEDCSSRAVYIEGLPVAFNNNQFQLCDSTFIEAYYTSLTIIGNSFRGLNKVPITLKYCYDSLIEANKAANTGDSAIYQFLTTEPAIGTVLLNNVLTKFDDIANLKSAESGSYPTNRTMIAGNTLLYGDYSINFTDEINTIITHNVVFPTTSTYQNNPDGTAVFTGNTGFGP